MRAATIACWPGCPDPEGCRMLERHHVLDLMGLKLAGMHASDEVIANGIRLQHPHQHVVRDLLTAEVADKNARSIKYQMTASKLPLAEESRIALQAGLAR